MLLQQRRDSPAARRHGEEARVQTGSLCALRLPLSLRDTLVPGRGWGPLTPAVDGFRSGLPERGWRGCRQVPELPGAVGEAGRAPATSCPRSCPQAGVFSPVPFQGSDFRVQSASSRGTAERAREARLPALASLRAWLLGGPCHQPRTAAALSPCGAGTGSSFAGLAGSCVLPAGGSFRTTCSTSILHLHVGGDNPSPGRAWLWCSSPLVGRGNQDTRLM